MCIEMLFPYWPSGRDFNQPLIFVFEVVYFIPQQLLSILSSEGDADMHGTKIFISKHSYLSISLWNLYTEPLIGYIVEPYDEVLFGTF